IPVPDASPRPLDITITAERINLAHRSTDGLIVAVRRAVHPVEAIACNNNAAFRFLFAPILIRIARIRHKDPALIFAVELIGCHAGNTRSQAAGADLAAEFAALRPGAPERAAQIIADCLRNTGARLTDAACAGSAHARRTDGAGT